MIKNRLARVIGLSVALATSAVLSACKAPQPSPTNIPSTLTPSVTQPPAPATANPLPKGSGECKLITNGPTLIHNRPHLEAQVFSEVGAAFETAVSGRTADGWLGFNPGVAQAANMGPFRLRWLHLDNVSLSGNCEAVNEMWAPQPGLCYTMPMEKVAVFETPFPDSAIITALDLGEFAAVLGSAGEDWAQVDLRPGNTGLDDVGWIERSTLNLNGPCDLPSVEIE